MKTLIPLYTHAGSDEWAQLIALMREDGHAKQSTIIINPAGGPGPDDKWPDRGLWLGYMQQLRKLGCRLALYIGGQNMQPYGSRMHYTPRDAFALVSDLALWRSRYLAMLGETLGTYYIDAHPVQWQARPEIAAFYAALMPGDKVIANLRCNPGPQAARELPAHELVIHEANGWPPLTEPTLGGKPAHVIACASPGLIPGAKRHASALYVHPSEWSGGCFQTLSPSLPQWLKRN
jgi:hypothetical protein